MFYKGGKKERKNLLEKLLTIFQNLSPTVEREKKKKLDGGKKVKKKKNMSFLLLEWSRRFESKKKVFLGVFVSKSEFELPK